MQSLLPSLALQMPWNNPLSFAFPLPKTDEFEREDVSEAKNDRDMLFLMLNRQQKVLQQVCGQIQNKKSDHLNNEAQIMMQQIRELENELGPEDHISAKTYKQFSSKHPM